MFVCLLFMYWWFLSDLPTLAVQPHSGPQCVPLPLFFDSQSTKLERTDQAQSSPLGTSLPPSITEHFAVLGHQWRSGEWGVGGSATAGLWLCGRELYITNERENRYQDSLISLNMSPTNHFQISWFSFPRTSSFLPKWGPQILMSHQHFWRLHILFFLPSLIL